MNKVLLFVLSLTLTLPFAYSKDEATGHTDNVDKDILTLQASVYKKATLQGFLGFPLYTPVVLHAEWKGNENEKIAISAINGKQLEQPLIFNYELTSKLSDELLKKTGKFSALAFESYKIDHENRVFNPVICIENISDSPDTFSNKVLHYASLKEMESFLSSSSFLEYIKDPTTLTYFYIPLVSALDKLLLWTSYHIVGEVDEEFQDSSLVRFFKSKHGRDILKKKHLLLEQNNFDELFDKILNNPDFIEFSTKLSSE